MNTFTIPEGTKEVKIDQINNKVIIEFIPQVEKFEPKDGDIVYWHNKRDKWSKNVAIFKNSKSTYYFITISKHKDVVIDSEFSQDEFDFIESKDTIELRFATDSEKQLLFNKLAER